MKYLNIIIAYLIGALFVFLILQQFYPFFISSLFGLIVWLTFEIINILNDKKSETEETKNGIQ